MTEAQEELIAKMLHWAGEISRQSPDGALHVFIADGNCTHEDLAWCAEQPHITSDESAFLAALRFDLSEEAVSGAWALSQLA